MAEYIKREVVFSVLADLAATIGAGDECTEETIKACMRALRAIPAADVAPVVHGHWCMEEYEFFNCSVCGGSYYTGAESTKQAKSYLSSGNTYAYCPSCGAKMEEAR